MANRLYPKGAEKILSASINFSSATLKAVLVDAAQYTPNFSTHEFLSDIPSGARASITSALTSLAVTGGVFDAADSNFAAVPAGPPLAYVVIYKDTGVAGTSPLLVFIDTGANLPVTPVGADIPLVWANSAAKIFSLV